jgi:hypothetical protein
MKVITVISDTTESGYEILKLSCAINKLTLVTLVCNQKRFSSNRMKDALLFKYLQTLDEHELILFTDGYDSFFLADEKEILGKYDNLTDSILFSAEMNCYPDTNLQHYYPAANTPYRFLNSGGFIGKAGMIKDMLLRDLPGAADKFQYSNQYLWTLRFIQFPQFISLDTQCDIFCTFSSDISRDILLETDPTRVAMHYKKMDDWFKLNSQLTGHRLSNQITGTLPCIAHFNGRSKYLMKDAVLELIFSRV